MSQYLYVCHFSNGLIKVGRSIDPVSRIAQHADRVSCMGVELIEHHAALCVSHVIPAEKTLIHQCKKLSSKVMKNEWFEGLNYLQICEIASVVAATKFESKGMTTENVIRYFGSQKATADALGMKQPSVAVWGEYPPELRQLQIESLTGGELRAEPECDKYRVAA